MLIYENWLIWKGESVEVHFIYHGYFTAKGSYRMPLTITRINVGHRETSWVCNILNKTRLHDTQQTFVSNIHIRHLHFHFYRCLVYEWIMQGTNLDVTFVTFLFVRFQSHLQIMLHFTLYQQSLYFRRFCTSLDKVPHLQYKIYVMGLKNKDYEETNMFPGLNFIY